MYRHLFRDTDMATQTCVSALFDDNNGLQTITFPYESPKKLCISSFANNLSCLVNLSSWHKLACSLSSLKLITLFLSLAVSYPHNMALKGGSCTETKKVLGNIAQRHSVGLLQAAAVRSGPHFV